MADLLSNAWEFFILAGSFALVAGAFAAVLFGVGLLLALLVNR